MSAEGYDLPLVTVYLPTHNRLAALQRAIASVRAQTYPFIELIVVDDGSRDGTAEFLAAQQAAGTLRFLRVLRNHTPHGACVARNLAIDAAQGTLITGLDDDDEFTPERVERLVAAFTQAGAKVSCVASGLIEVNGLGHQRARRGYSGVVSLERLLHGNAIGNQVLTRTQWLRDIGGFDPRMPALQDYDTWVRLVKDQGPALKVRDTLYRWHNGHGAQITHNSEARIQGFAHFMHKHGALMNAKQHSSMQVLQAKLEARRLPLLQALGLANRYNLRPLMALILAQRAQPLLAMYRKIRAKDKVDGQRGRK